MCASSQPVAASLSPIRTAGGSLPYFFLLGPGLALVAVFALLAALAFVAGLALLAAFTFAFTLVAAFALGLACASALASMLFWVLLTLGFFKPFEAFFATRLLVAMRPRPFSLFESRPAS